MLHSSPPSDLVILNRLTLRALHHLRHDYIHMRLCWFSAWLSICSVAWTAQIPLQAPETLSPLVQDDDISATRTTLVDLLTASEDHKLLVQLLQRSRLVPTLNRIANQVRFEVFSFTQKRQLSC